MRPYVHVMMIAIFAAAVLGADLGKAAELNERPNIVLVVADDLSPTLGCYGNEKAATPNLDLLASEGVRFTHAFSTTASCSASRSVILTGVYNHANGHYGHSHDYHHFSSYAEMKSLPVMLTESGYRSILIGKLHVEPLSVYKFEQTLPGNQRSPVEMAENCRKVINEKSDKPFFLYFCPADPHRSGETVDRDGVVSDAFGNRQQGYPGVTRKQFGLDQVEVPEFLPDNPTSRAELAEYHESVNRVDQGVGRLVQILKESGKWENTVFIFTADHGMAFPGAKTTVYEAGLRIPFLLYAPGLKNRGKTNDAMISLVDVTPTLLEVAGVPLQDKSKLKPQEKKRARQGRSFWPIVDQVTSVAWDEVYASHTFHEITMYYPMRMVRNREYKLIWNIAHQLPYPFASDLWEAPTWQSKLAEGEDAKYGVKTVRDYIHRPQFELYNIAVDPHESKNLAEDPQFAEVLAGMKEKLKKFQQSTYDPWLLKWTYE